MRLPKQFLSISLAFAYLFLSIGIGLKAHYCHNDLSSISISFAESSCKCADSEVEMKCCNTEEALIQFESDCLVQKREDSKLDIFVLTEVQEEEHDTPLSPTYSEQNGYVFIVDSPPFYLLNSSFLHYG